MPAVARLGGSRNIFSDITEAIGASARTGATSLGVVVRLASRLLGSFQPQLPRAHVAEPEQTRDEFGIKRVVTGVHPVETQ
jgi:hypothetical protein